MTETADRIRALAPPADDADWADVARRAGRSRLPRRALVLTLAGIVAVVAVLGASELTSRGRVEIVDRALAAAPRGPVLHVVLAIDTQDVMVSDDGDSTVRYVVRNLTTGTERPVETTEEFWADRDHLIHAVERIDGLPVWDSLAKTTRGGAVRTDPALAAFFTGYREALASGQAKPAGSGILEGRRVDWLRFPRTNGGVDSASEIGLDPSSGKALFLRSWCDECPHPAGPAYRIETLAGVERANVARAVRHLPAARFGDGGGHMIPLRDADRLLRRQALWAGRAVAGVPFSLVEYRWASRNSGTPPTLANSVSRGRGLVFLYGVQARAGGHGYEPIPGQPTLSVTVTPDAPFGPGNFFSYGLRVAQTVAGGPVPEYDDVALSHIAYGWDVQFRKDGLYVEVSAPTRALALAVTRAIEPLAR